MMRIAIVAPPWLPVPPPAYGGIEAVLDYLARGLRNGGHDVVLFTTGDSTCPVERVATLEASLGVGSPGPVGELRHVIAAYEQLAGFDIIHDHTLLGPIYAQWFDGLPVVTTNHGPFESELYELYRAIGTRVPIIAISQHHASTAKDIPIAAVIHHGVFTEEFPIGKGGGGYALFLGRMHPGKGVHIAARVAQIAGIPLRIAGKMSEPAEKEYFDALVQPLLGADVEYLGEVDHVARLSLLQDATCLLNPIAWPEPFGMVMVEALACGTPVITTPFGAAPEIVEHGMAGYVCANEAMLVDALHHIDLIDRSACRKVAEERFSVARMVEEHVSCYEKFAERRDHRRLELGSSGLA